MTFKFHINNTHDVVFSCWAARGGGVGRQSGVRKSSLWAGKPPPLPFYLSRREKSHHITENSVDDGCQHR